MTSVLSYGDSKVMALVHCSLFSIVVCSAAEADEDVSQAYPAGLSEAVVVCGHPILDSRPCCHVILDYYYSEEQDYSEAVIVQYAV